MRRNPAPWGSPTRTEPELAAAITPTRRRISARITTSPSSAKPIISERRCAASKGSANVPAAPAWAVSICAAGSVG